MESNQSRAATPDDPKGGETQRQGDGRENDVHPSNRDHIPGRGAPKSRPENPTSPHNPWRDRDTTANSRDVVGAALREGRHQQTGGGWVWERQEGQPDAAGLPGIQIMGTTQAHPRFTYHAAFAGIGGGVVGFKQAGGCLRGAFEADSRMRRVFEANHDLVPQTSHRRVLSEGWPEEADVLMVGNLTEAPRGSDVLEPRIKLAWDAGRGARYKIAVFEFRASFVGADNGARLGAFQRRLRGCGYQVTTKRLYAPDFGAAVAAWRWWVVGLRGDLAAKGSQFHWPDRCSEHHPLRAMLEWDATKVKGHWIRGTRWRQPACSTREPRPGTRLRQVGWVGCDERGRRVYDVNGLAAPQTGTTHQLDFGNGLYAVGGGFGASPCGRRRG